MQDHTFYVVLPTSYVPHPTFYYRYVEAYRKQLQLEAASRSRPLPPLCACGLDPLENHTDQCARNCYFFKNPQAYGRALSGLYVRPIVLD